MALARAQQVAAGDDADRRARLRIDDVLTAHIVDDHQIGDSIAPSVMMIGSNGSPVSIGNAEM
ncbi:hypothetical protein ACFO8O_12045 [Hephaestia sp. GCM10023244]|uniref:hypothetical protein n=1 Tax=unclassified Hephaestia TaxID=2631281 RepID=UPI00207712E9|nr:hypothetical protein [Hephaestia sp. MAHUQ-44]MCM8731690.1 hypothetical protein [Hephaestia sp. MAHUQ-44]